MMIFSSIGNPNRCRLCGGIADDFPGNSCHTSHGIMVYGDGSCVTATNSRYWRDEPEEVTEPEEKAPPPKIQVRDHRPKRQAVRPLNMSRGALPRARGNC